MSIDQLNITRLNLRKLVYSGDYDSFRIHFIKSKLHDLTVKAEQLFVPESILLFMLQRDMVVNKNQFCSNETIEDKISYDQYRLQRNLKILIKIGPDYIKNNGFTASFIKMVHKHLTGASMRKNGLDRPGRFRKQTVWIGLLNAPKEDAAVVPLDARLIPEYVDDIISFINNDSIDPLIRLALFYFQFIAVHPFGNGNGRTARVLIPLLTSHLSLMSTPLLWMGSGLDSNRTGQFFSFRETFNESSYEPWLAYFMNTLENTIGELIFISDKLLAAQIDAIEVLSVLNMGPIAQDIIESFFCRPMWVITELEDYLNLPKSLFNEVIQKLIKSGWSAILSNGVIVSPSLQQILYNPSHLGIQ